VSKAPWGRAGITTLLDPREFRLRYLVAIMVGTILIAALLRHVLHVYGGLSREDIRVDALIAALIIGVAAILYKKAYHR
jgi:hypothetical protein